MENLLTNDIEFNRFMEMCSLQGPKFTKEEMIKEYNKHGLDANLVIVNNIYKNIIVDYFYIFLDIPIRINTTELTMQASCLKKNVNKVHECITGKETDLSLLLMYVEKRYLLHVLNLIYFDISNKLERRKFFREVYQTIEDGFTEIDEEIIKDGFTLNKDEKYKLKTQLDTLSNDEYLIIYRGQGSKSTPINKAYSWTTDLEVAKFFRDRYNSLNEDKKLYSAKVKKDKVIYYTNDRKESEIIINYKDLEEVAEESNDN